MYQYTEKSFKFLYTLKFSNQTRLIGLNLKKYLKICLKGFSTGYGSFWAV